jgi:site-specific recombinase XerD
MGRETFRKVITNDELIEQILPANKRLVERFLREKQARSSSGTVKGYASDLNIFMVWNLLNNDNKLFFEIKKLEFADFFNYCQETLRWSPARFGRMRSCLSSLSNFCEKFFDLDYPSFRNVILKAIESIPKVAVREKTVITDDQVDELLKYLSEELNNPQEACLLALAISSGARVSELLRFTTDIIDENNTAFNGIFIQTTKEIKTKGRSAYGKMLKKYIVKSIFMPYYTAWLPERDKILKETGKDHKFLFIKQSGDPAEVSTVNVWIRKWEKKINEPVYMHMFRHYLVTKLSRLGLSYELITEIFGWANGNTQMAKLYDDNDASTRVWKELDNVEGKL